MTNTLAPDSRQESQEIGASKAQGTPADRYTGAWHCLPAFLRWHAGIKGRQHQCKHARGQLNVAAAWPGTWLLASLEVASACLHRILPRRSTGLLSNGLPSAAWEQLCMHVYFGATPSPGRATAVRLLHSGGCSADAHQCSTPGCPVGYFQPVNLGCFCTLGTSAEQPPQVAQHVEWARHSAAQLLASHLGLWMRYTFAGQLKSSLAAGSKPLHLA